MSKRTLKVDGLGLGLRPAHYAYVLRARPDVDYFELLSDNYLREGSRARHYARRIRAHYVQVLHGVGLNLLGQDPLDERYLDALKALADEVDAPFVSDHLCWSRSQGLNHHDLLPTPFTAAIADYAAERAAYVQRRLDRPFAVENVSSYATFAASVMDEASFYARVVSAAGVYYLLDLNNVYVSAQNHGFDPYAYLNMIDFSRVVQVHLAGYEQSPAGVLIDTHSRPVSSGVWALYRWAYRHRGPFPTLLEWDDAIPSFEGLLAELAKAREVRS